MLQAKVNAGHFELDFAKTVLDYLDGMCRDGAAQVEKSIEHHLVRAVELADQGDEHGSNGNLPAAAKVVALCLMHDDIPKNIFWPLFQLNRLDLLQGPQKPQSIGTHNFMQRIVSELRARFSDANRLGLENLKKLELAMSGSNDKTLVQIHLLSKTIGKIPVQTTSLSEELKQTMSKSDEKILNSKDEILNSNNKMLDSNDKMLKYVTSMARFMADLADFVEALVAPIPIEGGSDKPTKTPPKTRASAAKRPPSSHVGGDQKRPKVTDEMTSGSSNVSVTQEIPCTISA